MKVYISADIEGVAGITHWDEAEIGKPGYETFRQQMTAEVAAACEGALAAGASEVLVKDAHWTGRNILPEGLPEPVRLIRGWSGDPLFMVQDLDASFDALAMVGYHSAAGDGGNPLAHSMSGEESKILVNGELMSEFAFHSYAAAELGVPSVFLSGDQNLCDTVKARNPAIHTVATKSGAGASTTSIHPALAVRNIREGMEAALGDAAARAVPALAETFELELWYKTNEDAYKASFYPGARLDAPHCVCFHTDSFYEIMRMLKFVL